MLTNKTMLVLITTLICVGCTNTTNQIKTTLDNYKSALIRKDTSAILQNLDTSFRLGIHQRPIANKMVKNLLIHTDLPDSVSFGAIQEKNNSFYTSATYHFASDSTSTSDITFSKNGKILFCDYFDQIYSFNRYDNSQKVTTIPFQFSDGSISIKTNLNNSSESLDMLFDTGADGMALKSSLADAVNAQITSVKTTNVPGGKVSVKFSSGNTIQLGRLNIHNQNMVLFDNLGRNCDGILGGANLFRNYITEIDFDKQIINLYSHGQFTAPNGYVGINMDYSEGVPVIPFNFYINNKQFESRFVFDSGAHYDAIMFGPDVKRHNINQFVPTLFSSYNNSPGKAARINIGQIDSLSLAGISFKDVNLAMEQYDNKRHINQTINGSLGIELLRRMNWIVDLTNYKIYLKPNSYFNQPLSFKLKNHYFQLTPDNRLIFKNNIRITNSGQLQPGDEIILIDGMSPSEITTEKINSLNKKKNIYLQAVRDNSSFQTKI